MLDLMNLHKSFGDARVLNEIDLRLQDGHVYSYKNGNGSGKTTLINIVLGFLKSDDGKVALRENKTNSFFPFRVNRLEIGRTLQDLRVVIQMMVHANLLLALKKCLLFLTKPNEIKFVKY